MLWEKEKASYILLLAKGLSNDEVGVARGIVFQEIRPRARLETGDFVKETLVRGYLRTTPCHPIADSYRKYYNSTKAQGLAKELEGHLREEPQVTPKKAAQKVNP